MGQTKRPDKVINPRIDQQYADINTDYSGLKDIYGSRIGPVAQKSDDLWNRINTGYSDLAGKFGSFADEARGMGTANADKFNRFGDEIAQWGRTPIDDETKNAFFGYGKYKEFADTGGVSQGERDDIMRQIAASTPRAFAQLKENLARQNLASGGANPGYNSQTAKLARDAATTTGDVVRGGRMDLAKMIREGQEWGAEGGTRGAASYQDAATKKYLGGMGLAGDTYKLGADSGLEGLKTAGNLLGGANDSMAGLRGLYTSVPGELDALMRGYGDTINNKNAALDRNLATDITNNPRGKAWWQTALDVAVPLGSSLLQKYGIPGLGGPKSKISSTGEFGDPNDPDNPLFNPGDMRRLPQYWNPSGDPKNPNDHQYQEGL